MSKWIFIALLITHVSISCNAQENHTTDIDKALSLAVEYVKGMEFKGLEAKGADTLFDEYKKIRIAIVEKGFKDKNIDDNLKSIRKIKNEFDIRSLEEIELGDVKKGYRENSYIFKFESEFVKKFIENTSSRYIEADKLKLFYMK